jgi:16S rRNA (cytidine1402-2'-O)-methyltransferase
MTIEAHFAYYLAQGMPKKEAVKAVARDRDLPKNEVYQVVMVKE